MSECAAILKSSRKKKQKSRFWKGRKFMKQHSYLFAPGRCGCCG